MLNLRRVAILKLRRLTRHPRLRHFSLTLFTVILVWLYGLHYGERTTYRNHIEACDWSQWETWPSEARPHHLVFISDPQLVDPHTYPGRPWPLSALTEMYTDLYMARNYMNINLRLDPDSVVFLGDLFDGGREWAPERVKRPRLAKGKVEEEDVGQPAVEIKELDDRQQFLHGENGRWKKWGQKQWLKDYERFGNIFFAAEHVYPSYIRQTTSADVMRGTEVNEATGAKDMTEWEELATSGGKQRQIITSLPGNHDLGFGAGVQLSVRERFQTYFGDSNRIDVIGNHTFVSLDALSLSAGSQLLWTGNEASEDEAAKLGTVWKPTVDFLDDLRTLVGKTVGRALGKGEERGLTHEVSHPKDLGLQPSASELAEEALKTDSQLPIILLTHVPLYRESNTDCGPMRERGKAISMSFGYQYQNVLTRSLSDRVVKKLFAAGELVAAFSGDDHDYCDMTHLYNVLAWNGGKKQDTVPERTTMWPVKEITVKSFSWAMGVRRPGFLLVSLWNPVDDNGESILSQDRTYQTHLCLLPDQLGIFVKYALLLGATVVILLVRAIILSLRQPPTSSEIDSEPPYPPLPFYQEKLNGTSNGVAAKVSLNSKIKGRQRAASSSASTNSPTHASNNPNGNLGVQRSYNARTRSVSPAFAANPTYTQSNHDLPKTRANASLIERAGYYPELTWADFDDDDDGSDEEDKVALKEEAKWKWRRRTPQRLTRPRRAISELVWSMVLVGGPAMCFYIVLVRTG